MASDRETFRTSAYVILKDYGDGYELLAVALTETAVAAAVGLSPDPYVTVREVPLIDTPASGSFWDTHPAATNIRLFGETP